MFLNGESGPNSNPLPSTYPSPLLRYSPSPILLPFCHGAKYNPLPAGDIFAPTPFRFKYTIPLPAILSTALLPAAAPTPVSAPVASEGKTLESKNLPAVASAGRIAGRKPPSILVLCC